jgi:hypothetical protein
MKRTIAVWLLSGAMALTGADWARQWLSPSEAPAAAAAEGPEPLPPCCIN